MDAKDVVLEGEAEVVEVTETTEKSQNEASVDVTHSDIDPYADREVVEETDPALRKQLVEEGMAVKVVDKEQLANILYGAVVNGMISNDILLSVLVHCVESVTVSGEDMAVEYSQGVKQYTFVPNEPEVMTRAENTEADAEVH